jgi:hypothetical protein
MHLWATLFQQAALVLIAADRCLPQPSLHSGDSSFLATIPQSCFSGMAMLLDWPFVTVAPAVWASAGVMSQRAACLASTLWVQVVVGFIIPTTLLFFNASDALDRRRGLGKMLHAWLGTSPVRFVLFAAQMSWLILRTLCALHLPAPSGK